MAILSWSSQGQIYRHKWVNVTFKEVTFKFTFKEKKCHFYSLFRPVQFNFWSYGIADQFLGK